ncbi:ATP-binding protein [Streptacidiphilus cavernicola]|uniref:ATP-binding protein n=1 Tax=Streptacidiphilus cavernicola TaxID=3342716 RepID=A0ABV6VP06_9ACTN
MTTTVVKPARAEVSLVSSPQAAGLARRFTSAQLRSEAFDSADLADAIELLMSELVTNVFRHTGTAEMVVLLHRDEQGVRAAVRDDSNDLPVLRDPAMLDGGGRGLLLLNAVASAWGIDRHPEGGKTVWFRLELA